jgi:hypothetical protein
MRHILTTFAFVCVAVVVACTGTAPTEGPVTPPASPSAEAGSPAEAGSSGASESGVTAQPKGCTPDPTCGRVHCHCPNGETLTTNSACRGSDGSCALFEACNTACGAVLTTTFVEVETACTVALSCPNVSTPSVDCTCNDQSGWTASRTCAGGYCSDSPSDVCPEACSTHGGWPGCKRAVDCADIVCRCSDGKMPLVPGECTTSGSCATADTLCPTACKNHGG